MYYLLFVFYSTMWPNSGHFQDIQLQNMSDLDFDITDIILNINKNMNKNYSNPK